MIDDKLKTGHEPPGPERSGDAPAKEAPLPPHKTAALEKAQEPNKPGAGLVSQPEQSVIPGMGEDNPTRSILGEVVVDFDKINKLMSQRRTAAHDAAKKAKAPPSILHKVIYFLPSIQQNTLHLMGEISLFEFQIK